MELRGLMKHQKAEITRLKHLIKLLNTKDAVIKESVLHQEAAQFADICLTKLRSHITDDLFSRIMLFWGVSEHYCNLAYQKLAEFSAYKKTNSRSGRSCLTRCFKALVAHYQKKWICVGYNNVWYYRKAKGDSYDIRDNIPLDKTSTLEILEVNKKYVVFSFAVSRRKIVLKVKDTCKGLYAVHRLLKAFILNHYTKVHDYGSFAPRRRFNLCDLYIRGESYFREVYELIKTAKQEIMITGWFISPEFPLIRPLTGPLDNDKTRLCYVLGEAARERGVLVYVLVYKEFSPSLYTDSEHVKTTLEKIHPNIKVIAHPKSFLFFWSHHEKMVIVDRKVVMLGGLDIAWGRWDNDRLMLFDSNSEDKFFPGIDYYNPFIKDFGKARYYEKSMLDGKGLRPPRMPWHDYGIRLEGPIVFDYLPHFVTYWNNAREEDGEHHVLVTQFILNPSRAAVHKYLKRTFKNLTDYQIMKAAGSVEDFSPVDRLKNDKVADIRKETDERQRFSRLLQEIDDDLQGLHGLRSTEHEENHESLRSNRIGKQVKPMHPNSRETKENSFNQLYPIQPKSVHLRLKNFAPANTDSKVFFVCKKLTIEERKKLEQEINPASLGNSLLQSEIASNDPNWQLDAHLYDAQLPTSRIKSKVAPSDSDRPRDLPYDWLVRPQSGRLPARHKSCSVGSKGYTAE